MSTHNPILPIRSQLHMSPQDDIIIIIIIKELSSISPPPPPGPIECEGEGEGEGEGPTLREARPPWHTGPVSAP
ncbi:hypothetical protein VSDG_08145 [Cytospora chrysosperma]|uniref:Uncharacterized protein n=1 Tax=Cytospora chrysosperma TaxID=252740 RepID=A0A423VGZ9_CYTCH|nr:hypothetical protein VSDG_08145 [Valsa sordida]